MKLRNKNDILSWLGKLNKYIFERSTEEQKKGGEIMQKIIKALQGKLQSLKKVTFKVEFLFR